MYNISRFPKITPLLFHLSNIVWFRDVPHYTLLSKTLYAAYTSKSAPIPLASFKPSKAGRIYLGIKVDSTPYAQFRHTFRTWNHLHFHIHMQLLILWGPRSNFCLPGSSTGILMHPIPQPSACYFPCFSCISARMSKHLGTQQQDPRLLEKHWWIQRFIFKQIDETLHHVVQRWSGWTPILDV